MRRAPTSILAGLALFLVFCSSVRSLAPQAGTTATQTPDTAANAGTVVPRLVQFTGTIIDASGKPGYGSVAITFSLYALQDGGAPLWSETQTFALDSQGHYTALLGAASPDGLPLDLFTSGAARWLGVAPALPGVGEQTRVLLVGVPYALKAADADTLGGRPASAYVTTDNAVAGGGAPGATGLNAGVDAGSAGLKAGATSAAETGANAKSKTPASTITGSGTTNYVPLWTGSTTLGNSALFQTGSGSTAKVGIGTTSPIYTLQVNGSTPIYSTGSGAGLAFQDRAGGTSPYSEWYSAGSVAKFWRSDKGDIIGVTSAGNVGIGTTSPTFTLQVNGSTPIYSTGTGAGLAFQDRAGGSSPYAEWYSTGDVARLWWLNKGDIVGVTSAGNVGIGTTAPVATLEVNGTAKFDQAVTFASGQTFPNTASLGSNVFVGNQTITGNLAVASNGTISLDTTGGGLAIQPTATSPNVIAGYSGNSVFGSAGATIGGGGETGLGNSVLFDFGTVSGGNGNTAGFTATVGGGGSNTANGSYATVAGGASNSAGGDNATVGGGGDNAAGYPNATVAGGGSNTAAGEGATVGGGVANVASNVNATVPGGASNDAQGIASFAAGQGAQALNDGAFVWADYSTSNPVASTENNQFIVRAAGGLWLGTNNSVSILTGQFIATSTGAYLSTGGTWTNASDRNLKENLSVVNQRSILKRVAALPMFAWNYKAQSSSVRHMGPMAQDFHAAFGLGEDDKHISTVGAEGVALAAIQELYKELKQTEASSRAKDSRIVRQAGQIRQLTTQVERLESLKAQMAALQARLDRLDGETRTLEARSLAK